MLKEKIRESEQSEAQKQPKWKNVLFDKDGNSYDGDNLWDTIQQAQEAVRKWEARARMRLSDKAVNWYVTRHGKRLFYRDYAWSMQIPILN